MLMDSQLARYIFSIFYKIVHFSLPLNPTIQRIGNAAKILSWMGIDFQFYIIFCCNLSRISLTRLLTSELIINMKYFFTIPFRITLKIIIMGTSPQFHDRAQLKFYPHLAQRYYTSGLVLSRNLCQGLELPFIQ